jgi:hypothetical protein
MYLKSHTIADFKHFFCCKIAFVKFNPNLNYICSPLATMNFLKLKKTQSRLSSKRLKYIYLIILVLGELLKETIAFK